LPWFILLEKEYNGRQKKAQYIVFLSGLPVALVSGMPYTLGCLVMDARQEKEKRLAPDQEMTNRPRHDHHKEM
jgi:hypothetical protein